MLENRSKVSREFLDKFQQSCKCLLQLSSSHLLNICIAMITAIKDQGHLLKYLIMSRHGLWQNSLFLQQVPEEGVRGIQRVMTTHCLISQNIFIDYDHCTVSFHLLYNYSWTASAACPGTAVCKNGYCEHVNRLTTELSPHFWRLTARRCQQMAHQNEVRFQR